MTEEARTLKFILCWHMHQPDYRNALTREFELPWTYLHALKDYTDMAAHLERYPNLPVVVNLVPSLMDQLVDYAEQFHEGTWRDPLLRWLVTPSLEELSMAERHALIGTCLRCHAPKMIDPFPGYARLRDCIQRFQKDDTEPAPYVSGQFLADLLVWYHLAWMGESLRKTVPLLGRLMAQGGGYTLADRQDLNTLIGETLNSILPRYRALQQSGQVELSTTPNTHPILPLLLDFATAREAVPHLALPRHPLYPGGENRAIDHIRKAFDAYHGQFGQNPTGFWPGEGALSTATLEMFAAQGLAWTASSENVLAKTLRLSWGQETLPKEQWLYQPYLFKTEDHELRVFFRDDQLSDRIGFEYAQWDGKNAAEDFIRQLEMILETTPKDRDPVVTVILDGENAWEYYPYNGYYFLDYLYQALDSHPVIRPVTFSALCQQPGGMDLPVLKKVVAGSWVYGSLTTWMGNADKNAAWDLLVEAKVACDRVLPTLSRERQDQVNRQLAVCEGSDWFWWFGDYNMAESVQLFDRLYRLNLTTLYQLLSLDPPRILSLPFSRGSRSQEAGGAMRRNIHP
ncbi:glycoside hydrolase family 57 protein [Ferrovum sp.]|uniref:glycoside hydrolase family 57 protein n=1 Tax=Ferrovum sp. TaxID=2609467 RepID=UPI002603A3EC|nr:glycoside hydrolase family 57 protein [Ferrovum sp.]